MRMRNSAEPRYSRIMGLGVYRPARSVPNSEIAEGLGLTEEWIERRSGVRSRRYAGAEETLTAMSVAAAEKALAQAGVDADRIGFVLVATTTHLTQMPSLASEVALRVGATEAGALDILAACAGFSYGLAMGSDMVRAGTADHVLIVAAERVTDILDHSDPSTAFLFADGAGAVVVGPSATPGIGPVIWGSDAGRADAVGMTGFWHPSLRTDPETPWPVLGMIGWKVYRWAVENLATAGSRALEAAGVTVNELSAFIPHQANRLITEEMAARLKLPPGVVVAQDVRESGNTSSASIPLAMDTLLSKGEVVSGELALLIGFGSGVVYASQVVRLP
ncbi:beta-ketoacyl-ACP synthase 3 [Sinosporangium siamense]|uniref:3-oxoacyl-[acyl-carrier-protein] synthase 3 protein 1 n=1 Tax=Sinosporangium siamense TaxID=1367973 RepID=A0A919RJT4_9ACTN|nr:beta-ketoacyl-ACP synthase 3 [Sinosporangium siamense]GII95083.1 3-oxoacyl-[acyl-carrier-protein] synthase 3 protein 1 [Sinosporangium siamense]